MAMLPLHDLDAPAAGGSLWRVQVLKIAASALAGALALSPVCAAAANITLAAHGQTDYCIVISADAIAPEKTAANELRDCLKQMTGADFPVKLEGEVSEDQPQILVGPSARLRSLAPKVDWQAFGTDGILMRTQGRNLLLAGGRPRGTLYAVETFLEDVGGCRWWTSSESTIPHHGVFTIPALDRTCTPKIRSREAFYRDCNEHPNFAVRLKLNGRHQAIDAEHGGHNDAIGWCHTFYRYLPPDKYFAAHPDWYSEIDGKRTTQNAQLCLTNEEMRREMTRVVLQLLRENPDATIVDLSQNDCYNSCQCPRCREVDKEEGSPSGALIRFVNAVAAEVKKEHPGVLVQTLAYQYTRKPPKITRPADNVLIRLCSIECSFFHPLESDVNRDFRDDMLGWKAIAKNLCVWDYVTDFTDYLRPHPNLQVLGDNIRFFERNHAIGVFEQGDANTTVGDFVRMRAWVIAHLLWAPSRDEDALIGEFLKGYYGPAAPYLRQYLDVVHDAWGRTNAKLSCFSSSLDYLNLSDMNRAQELFNKAAEAVKGDPALAERVRRERLPLDHVWLMRVEELQAEAAASGQPYLGPRDVQAACNEFIQQCESRDVRNYNETVSFQQYAANLRERFRPPVELPEELRSLPKDGLQDIQDGRFNMVADTRLVEIKADPLASDGKAARMPGNHYEWAVQCSFTRWMKAAWPGEWDCWVVIRCDGDPAAPGGAFRAGIYDPSARKDVTSLERTAATGAGGYQVVNLGRHDLQAGDYVWVSPAANPAVSAVWVDRIIFAPARR